MRPKSIVTFERLALLSLAISLVVTALTWEGNVAAYRSGGYGPSFLWFLTAVEVGVGLLLIFLISRKGSPVAKWILTVLTAAGVLELVMKIGDRLDAGLLGIAEIVKMILLAAAVSFLFRADAKEWLGRKS